MSLKNSPELENLFSKKPYLRIYFSSDDSKNKILLKEARTEGEYFLEKNSRPYCSTIAPKKQAERLVLEKKIKDNHLIIVLGCGNPHLLELLNSIMREGQILIMVDENPGVVQILWEKFLLKILEKAGRHIFGGEASLSLLYNYVESLPIENLTGVLFFRNPTDNQFHKEYYQSLEERISKLFSSKMSDLLTKFEFERIWVKNTICSILRYSEKSSPRFPINILENKIREIPAILVSAGPSLRSQCSFLKSIRDKVFILSCDTSLKVLIKFGIIPDGVMTLDAQTHSYFHFMGEDLKNIPLFADMVVSPQLIRSMSFLSIIHSQTAKFQIDAAGNPIRESTAGSELVSQYLGNQGDIQSGGSVATSAFDVLKYLGFKKIILMGQDLAYTGREIHSTGTHHNEKWLTLLNRKNSLERINEVIVRKRKTKLIPSAGGNEVLTDYVLELYRHWFEESALNVDIEIFNISSKGALIKNINNINLEKAETYFKNIEKHDYPWKKLSPWSGDINEYPDTGILREIFLEDIYLLENKIKEFEQSNSNSIEIIEFLKEELKEKSYLNSMIRKTIIYLRRHKNEFSKDKEKELFLNSIKKEIKFLKKGILTSL